MILEALASPVAVAAFVSGVFALVTYLLSRRKVLAEANHVDAQAGAVTVSTAMDLMNSMKARLEQMESRLDELEEENRSQAKRIVHLEGGVRLLQGQLVELGADPAFRLPD